MSAIPNPKLPQGPATKAIFGVALGVISYLTIRRLKNYNRKIGKTSESINKTVDRMKEDKGFEKNR